MNKIFTYELSVSFEASKHSKITAIGCSKDFVTEAFTSFSSAYTKKYESRTIKYESRRSRKYFVKYCIASCFHLIYKIAVIDKTRKNLIKYQCMIMAFTYLCLFCYIDAAT